MVRADRAPTRKLISRTEAGYPERLIARLGGDAPQSITIIGTPAPLTGPTTAFLCSKETPGATILKAFDQAAAWRDAGVTVVSGFHSPLEKECLAILLRGSQPVVWCPARSLAALRLAPEYRRAFDDGRLVLVSPFAAGEKRATAALARRRNLFVSALADEVVFGFVAPGGSLASLRHAIEAWGGRTRELHAQ